MWTSGGRVGAAGPDFPHARYGRRGCPAPPAGSRLGRVRRAAAPRAPIPPSRVGLDARRVLRVPRAGADRRGPVRTGARRPAAHRDPAPPGRPRWVALPFTDECPPLAAEEVDGLAG